MKQKIRRMRTFKSGDICWSSSPSLPSVRMRPSASWIAIGSSSTMQIIRSSSCLPRSAFREATPWAGWTSSS